MSRKHNKPIELEVNVAQSNISHDQSNIFDDQDIDVSSLESAPQKESREIYVEKAEDAEELDNYPHKSEEETLPQFAKNIPNKVLIRSVAKRPNLVKVLKVLYTADEPVPFSQIFQHLHATMAPQTLTGNLIRLIRLSLIKFSMVTPLDSRMKFYDLVDCALTELIIKRYHWLLGLRLAPLLPYDKILYLDDLREQVEFQKACQKYYLTFEELPNILRDNTRKVEVEYAGAGLTRKAVGFSRKAQ